MLRYCANCGTEVDETAVFCPTCGQPIEQDTETEIPPAPAWPDPDPLPIEDRAPATSLPPRQDNFRDEPTEDRWADESEPMAEPSAAGPDDPTRIERRPEPEAEPAAAPRHAFLDDEDVDERADRRSEAQPPAAIEPPAPDAPPAAVAAAATHSGSRADAAPGRGAQQGPAAPRMPDLPITTPVTLSAWLIGGGAALAALGAIFALFDGLGTAVDILLLVGLLGIAATVFLANVLPAIPQLRLVTIVAVLVAFGVALDRLGFGRAGAGELLLFLGTAAAAMGAILVETGNDQPLGGPSA